MFTLIVEVCFVTNGISALAFVYEVSQFLYSPHCFLALFVNKIMHPLWVMHHPWLCLPLDHCESSLTSSLHGYICQHDYHKSQVISANVAFWMNF